jgi:hypothetical protein
VSGSLTYATSQAAAVPAASLGSYQGAGNVSLTAIDDDTQPSAATMSSAWFVGGTVTTEIQACATYVALAAAPPEAPMVALIPIAAVAVGRGILFARRRRTA